MPKPKIKPEEIDDAKARVQSLLAAFPDIHQTQLVPVDKDNILPSPSASINRMTSEGGFRPGSFVVWYGPESTLKTWIALEMVREAQRKWPERSTAYFDSEFRVDMDAAMNRIGVQTGADANGGPRFVYHRANSADFVYDRMLKYVKTEQFSLIVLDSITNLIPDAQLEKPNLDLGQVANVARVTSNALKQITPALEKHGVILWCISQVRTLQIHPHTKTGPSGGKAIGFYPSHIIRCESMEKKTDMDTTKLKIKFEKNKYGPPLREAEVPIILGHGINREGDVLNVAADTGVIERSASGHYKLDGELIGHGINAASERLVSDPLILNTIMERLNASSNS